MNYILSWKKDGSKEEMVYAGCKYGFSLMDDIEKLIEFGYDIFKITILKEGEKLV